MRIGGLLSVLSAVVLASPAPALAGAPQYRTANETRFGKAWVAQRQDAPSVAEAVRLTLADAAAFFGTRPKLGRAYEDSRTHRSGGATFTVDYLNVDKIVDDLNKGDPDRYRQIPLRDELHPVDGR